MVFKDRKGQSMAIGRERGLDGEGFRNCSLRWALLAFGWVNVCLGLIGIIIPVMPTTIFMIIAFWAFTKSSKRFHDWLWTHPRFGPPLQAWHVHRVIPLRAKILATAMMASSFLVVTVFVAESWVLPSLLALVLAPVCAYLLSRNSTIPEAIPESGNVI
jgi:hypothetical protein